jgi:hypothetical protein
VGWAFFSPWEARVIGDEIWVCDQVEDAIHRFDMDRNYLSSITAHPGGGIIDNLRGFGSDGSNVYLCLFHSDTSLRGIAVYDTLGNPTNFLPVSASLFDVAPFMGDLLVSSSTSNDVERRSAADGSLISIFAADVTFPQYIEVLEDDSVIAVSTIAPAGVEGVYHFNADGTLRLFIDTEPAKLAFGQILPHAAWLLDDGNYLITADGGVLKYDVELGTFSMILPAVDAQFIAPISIDSACDLAGDVNGDALVDGGDVSGFTNCILTQLGGNCDCADINGNGLAGLEDVSQFVDLMLGP